MSASLAGVIHKLGRAEAHIHNLEQQLSVFSKSEPYSAKVMEDVDSSGKRVGRLMAMRNKGVPDPDAIPWVLLAGEAATNCDPRWTT